MDFDEFEAIIEREVGRDFFSPLAKQVREYAKKHFGAGNPPAAERLRLLFEAANEDVPHYVDVPEDTKAVSSSAVLTTRVNEWVRGRGDYRNALAVYFWLNFFAEDLTFAHQLNSEVLSEETRRKIEDARHKMIKGGEGRTEEAVRSHPVDEPIWDKLDQDYGVSREWVSEIDLLYLTDLRWTLTELLERAPKESPQYRNVVLGAAKAAVNAHRRDKDAREIRERLLEAFKDEYEYLLDAALKYNEVDFEFGEPTVKHLGHYNGREVGFAIFRGGDHWFGELKDGQPNGVGAWHVYSVFVDNSADAPNPVNEWSGEIPPDGARDAVYRFANGSTFLGSWRNNAPSFGLMINPTSKSYSMFLGPMGTNKTLYGQFTWVPKNVGIVALTDASLAIGEIEDDRVINPEFLDTGKALQSEARLVWPEVMANAQPTPAEFARVERAKYEEWAKEWLDARRSTDGGKDN